MPGSARWGLTRLRHRRTPLTRNCYESQSLLATALTVISSAALAAGSSTTNQTQSVAAGVSSSVLVGSGSYTSNSTSTAGANAGSTVTPAGSAGTASAFHNSTSTASGSGTNGARSRQAAVSVPPDRSLETAKRTRTRMRYREGDRHDRTRREPLHGYGCERQRQCQCGCRGADGQWGSGAIATESLQLVDRVEYRPGRFAVRIGRKPGRLERNREQSLVRGGGTSFPATLVSFPHCCHVRSWHEAEPDCRRSDARVSDGVWR